MKPTLPPVRPTAGTTPPTPAQPLASTQKTAAEQGQPAPQHTGHHGHRGFHGGSHHGFVFRHSARGRNPLGGRARPKGMPKARPRRARRTAGQQGFEEDHFSLHHEEDYTLQDIHAMDADNDPTHQGDPRDSNPYHSLQQQKQFEAAAQLNDTQTSLPRCRLPPKKNAQPFAASSLSQKDWPGIKLLFGPHQPGTVSTRELLGALASVFFRIIKEPAPPASVHMQTSVRSSMLLAAMQAYISRAGQHAPLATLADVKAVALEAMPGGAKPRPTTERDQNAYLLFVPYALSALRPRTPSQQLDSVSRLNMLQAANRLRLPTTAAVPTPEKKGKP